MARISVGGGVSDARALPGQPGYAEPAPVEAPALGSAVEDTPVEPDRAPVSPQPPAPPAPVAVPVQDAPVAAPADLPSAAPAGKGGTS